MATSIAFPADLASLFSNADHGDAVADARLEKRGVIERDSVSSSVELIADRSR